MAQEPSKKMKELKKALEVSIIGKTWWENDGSFIAETELDYKGDSRITLFSEDLSKGTITIETGMQDSDGNDIGEVTKRSGVDFTEALNAFNSMVTTKEPGPGLSKSACLAKMVPTRP